MNGPSGLFLRVRNHTAHYRDPVWNESTLQGFSFYLEYMGIKIKRFNPLFQVEIYSIFNKIVESSTQKDFNSK